MMSSGMAEGFREPVPRSIESVDRETEKRVRERTEELESFIHMVSHDLRSPLVTIAGFIYMLQKDYATALDQRGRSYLEQIDRATKSMGQLTEHLLTYSRLGRAELVLAPVAVSGAFQEAVENLAREVAESGGTLEIEDSPLWVVGDRATLAQVLTNLISNAVKYAPAGDFPEVRVWAEEVGSRVRISVEDNGIGIAQEHQERIFQIFERCPGVEDYAGSGLGLSIVKTAALRMEGSVGVESEPDRGSTFWIELRRAEQRSASL